MNTIHAIILGAIQGLTEFIPVSSSGHLIAVPHLLGWNYQGKAFDAAIHLGTLAALLAYYKNDWISILSGFGAKVFKNRPYPKDAAKGADGRLLVPIIVASIPAAIVGVLFNDFIDKKLSEWYVVVPMLVVFGLVMLFADMLSKKQRDMSQMTYVDYITIGIAQAIALIPGVSRSGVTISAGLFRNLDRSAAARFSFLLSTPTIAGAGLFALKDMHKTGFNGEFTAFIWGFISAAVFGYIAIHFLISFLQKRGLGVFVAYRILLAAGLVMLFLMHR